VAAGKEHRTKSTHRRRITSIAFSPDGLTMVSVNRDGTIHVWHVETWEERLTLRTNLRDFCRVAFSADGLRFVAGDNHGPLKVWDTASGKELAAHDLPAGFIAYAPDGKTAALRKMLSWELSLWDFDTARTRATVPLLQVRARWAEISPDSRTLVVLNGEGNLAFVDVATGRVRATLTDPRHWVYALALSPDGRTLVTGSWDGSVKFWRTGRRGRTAK
jgi:WD40 repeat protein